MSMVEAVARIGVLLVDDHAVVREGYRRLLERDDRLSVVDEASSAAETLRLDTQLRPDVIVLDIALPGVSGIEILRRILSRRPEACVLMFSMYQDGIYATRALQAGARGSHETGCDRPARAGAVWESSLIRLSTGTGSMAESVMAKQQPERRGS